MPIRVPGLAASRRRRRARSARARLGRRGRAAGAGRRDPATPGPPRSASFQERLAYSPNRDEARRLLDELGRAEREGRRGDAEQLASRIERL